MVAGVKRAYSEQEMETSEPTPKSMNSFMPMFETFRHDLDEHQERRERVIKTSRDITALSKKIIFSLQRASGLRQHLQPHIVKTISPFQVQIHTLFAAIAPDLRSTNTHRYQRQISPGIQEYIEALSFQHYLETQSLITQEEAQKKIPGGVLLTEDDYLLGLFDMTGELMRYAITGIAMSGTLPGSEKDDSDVKGKGNILGDLRGLRMGFEGLDLRGSGLNRDAEKKMEVMRQSVEKVEAAVYGLVVRGSERPKGWVPDLSADSGREAVESY